MITNINGRKILVQFTCIRCCAKETVEVSERDANDRLDRLEKYSVPDGWLDRGEEEIFCPKCHEAYEQFMREGMVHGE